MTAMCGDDSGKLQMSANDTGLMSIEYTTSENIMRFVSVAVFTAVNLQTGGTDAMCVHGNIQDNLPELYKMTLPLFIDAYRTRFQEEGFSYLEEFAEEWKSQSRATPSRERGPTPTKPTQTERKNLRTLGIRSWPISEEKLTRAYKKMSLLYHPDHCPRDADKKEYENYRREPKTKEECTEYFKEIRAAYDALLGSCTPRVHAR